MKLLVLVKVALLKRAVDGVTKGKQVKVLEYEEGGMSMLVDVVLNDAVLEVELRMLDRKIRFLLQVNKHFTYNFCSAFLILPRNLTLAFVSAFAEAGFLKKPKALLLHLYPVHRQYSYYLSMRHVEIWHK